MGEWTTVEPATSGYYWYRDDQYVPQQIVYFDSVSNNVHFIDAPGAEGTVYSLPKCKGGRWIGPLPEPRHYE